jgi:hypothetical protein
MIIPTASKTRLPPALAYPVGVELLSKHLAGVPHFPEFRIRFSDAVGAQKSDFQEIMAQGSDYDIVRVTLWPSQIYVFPVKRVLKHAAREALVVYGLPQLREWVLKRGMRLLMTHATCRIIFSPSTQTMHFQEQDQVG